MTQRKSRLPRFSIRTLLTIVTLVAVGLFAKRSWDEHQRIQIATEWVSLIDRDNEHAKLTQFHNFPFYSLTQIACPREKSPEEQVHILVTGVFKLKESYQRIACLKILAEQFPDDSLQPLLTICFKSKEREVRIRAIQLIGFHRDLNAIAKLEELQQLPALAPEIRAAIIDCMAITRKASHSLSANEDLIEGFMVLDCEPAIHFGPIAESAFHRINKTVRDPPIIPGVVFQNPISQFTDLPDVPLNYRNRFAEAMLGAQSPEERIAAARAIVAWPPDDYKLRIAEWGVWINVEGQFHLAQSVIDEIPSFVHRAGNNLESFADRLTIPMIVTKPVFHLTVNKPMAIDLEVLITGGRPWFAYPKPNDFTLNVQQPWGLVRVDPNLEQQSASSLDRLDSLESPKPGILSAPREGYPWLVPKHRLHYATAPDNISGLGLRWQSMIVSPERLHWMKPPVVSDDEQFSWWKQLRQVDCSWVSNENESERFAYYDGPTLANSPKRFELEDEVLKVYSQPIFDNKVLGLYSPFDHEHQIHRGMFVEVDDEGHIAARLVDLKNGVDIKLPEQPLLANFKAKQKLRELILEAGLLEKEAQALMDCWDSHFFQEPGQRLIYLLRREEYDYMCPLTVRPEPTEISRVGLVTTEFFD